MLKTCRENKKEVLKQIQNKQVDVIIQSKSSFIDDIILEMANNGAINSLNKIIPDERRYNSSIPQGLLLTLAIAAKMKHKTSLVDIPFAIQDHVVLSKLSYNLIDTDYSEGWMKEGTIRNWIGKYQSKDFFKFYNKFIEEFVFKNLGKHPNIHTLDCTKLAVNYDNLNYEDATVAIDRLKEKMRGYKLACLRGIIDDSGIIEHVIFGTASTHDLKLSKDILRNSECLKEGDILLMDRGFFSREEIALLKYGRNIDVYIPLKKNTSEYNMAVAIAEETDDWKPHPTKKNQMVCHVPLVNAEWDGNEVEYVVDFNAAVVWSEEEQIYYVFVTTDLTKNANEIIKTYELRTEIEEDFRQLKDFWDLENFKSTKKHVIAFHIMCMLLGYLFYQLYLLTNEGRKYIGKSLPVILKNYVPNNKNYLAIYSGDYFCIMKLKEFIIYRDNCNEEIKEYLVSLL